MGSFQGEYKLKNLRMYWHRCMLVVGEQREKRIDHEDSRALTFEEVLEAYKGQFDVAECHWHWSKYMALSECVCVVHIERPVGDRYRTKPPDW